MKQIKNIRQSENQDTKFKHFNWTDQNMKSMNNSGQDKHDLFLKNKMKKHIKTEKNWTKTIKHEQNQKYNQEVKNGKNTSKKEKHPLDPPKKNTTVKD